MKKVRNVLRKIVQRYGPPVVKRALWDREFARGKWNCLERFGTDPIYPHLEQHARQGHILDLGCGPGTTANELSPAVYQTYTGVDISEVALQTARRRSKEHGRGERHKYVQADLSSYEPTGSYDVILLGDSIYYLPPKSRPSVLTRYATHLTPSGVFIIKVNGMPKHYPIVLMIDETFNVVEKTFYQPDVYVLTCRPR
jgi:SAM-dependent methyltransferase